MSAPELALYLSFIAEVLRDQTPNTFPGAADGSDDEDEVAPIATKGLVRGSLPLQVVYS